MFKTSYLHTNNALAPLPEQPEEKRLAPTITALPSKGQKSNPLKFSDVPAEVKQRYRKMSTKDLGRMVERAGGETTPKGRIYAAVLEERSVNPTLAGKNPNLARSTPFSVYKTAQYTNAVHMLDKIANQAMENPDKRFGGKAPDVTQVDARLGGAIGGATSGALVGAIGGLVMPGKGKLVKIIGGTGAGAMIGGAHGALRKPKLTESDV
jgi:hypothetical protein